MPVGQPYASGSEPVSLSAWWQEVSAAFWYVPCVSARGPEDGEKAVGVFCESDALPGKSHMAPPSDQASTVSMCSESISSVSERGSMSVRSVAWESVWLGHRLKPHIDRAECLADIYVLGALLELSALPDIDEESVVLLFKSVRFLRSCNYSAEDICSILAHASAYFIDIQALCGKSLKRGETGNILVTLMYIAHSYVQDETCPLKFWYSLLFRRYCPYHTLNAAVIRLLEIRKYVLRLEEEDLATRYTVLIQAHRRF